MSNEDFKYSNLPNDNAGWNKGIGNEQKIIPTRFLLYFYLLPNKGMQDGWMDILDKLIKSAARLLY